MVKFALKANFINMKAIYLTSIFLLGFFLSFSQDLKNPAFTFKQDRHRVLSLALSPDNKWLASGGTDNQIVIWNLNKKEKLFLMNDLFNF